MDTRTGRIAREYSRQEFLSLGIAAAGAGLMFAGCSASDAAGGGGGSEADKLRITYQPGTTTYAQLVIMEQEGWLADDLQDVDISWNQVDAGAAVRDAIASGKTDIGAGGIGPFLVGYDSGIDWRILSALDNVSMWLMVKDEKFKSLKDFKEGDKIAVVAPDSIQAVILRKGAQEQLGDPHALDGNMISLPSPDSVTALLNGQVAAHFTAPPFQFQEQDKGARPILKSFDLFGEHNLISLWVLRDFHEANPKIMSAVYKNVQKATKLIQDDPNRAGEILAKVSKIDPAEETRYLTEQGVSFTTTPRGFISFAKFMKTADLIKKVPGSWKDLVYDNIKNSDGS
ncbi:MAG TPA: ABC transporter substrate-binding protein [Rubrobacteraceae bacterium]|nr:ABC transporter substrate-binding protein [Rubrobacteraceae bacterium]